MSFRKTRF